MAAAADDLTSGSKTILLLEDQAALRVLLRDVLENSGYTVLEGETPQAALLLAAQYHGPLHLLLTDIVMPGISGLEVATRLCLIRPDARVLFMSGSPLDDHVVPLGADFIEKPFTLDELLRKLREVLDFPTPDPCPIGGSE